MSCSRESSYDLYAICADRDDRPQIWSILELQVWGTGGHSQPPQNGTHDAQKSLLTRTLRSDCFGELFRRSGRDLTIPRNIYSACEAFSITGAKLGTKGAKVEFARSQGGHRTCGASHESRQCQTSASKFIIHTGSRRDAETDIASWREVVLSAVYLFLIFSPHNVLECCDCCRSSNPD